MTDWTLTYKQANDTQIVSSFTTSDPDAAWNECIRLAGVAHGIPLSSVLVPELAPIMLQSPNGSLWKLAAGDAGDPGLDPLT